MTDIKNVIVLHYFYYFFHVPLGQNATQNKFTEKMRPTVDRGWTSFATFLL